MKKILWAIIALSIATVAHAALPWYCTFETDVCGGTIQGGTTRDTYTNFGVSAPPDGNPYILQLHSTADLDDADYYIAYYNTNAAADAFFRVYFFIPTGFEARTGQANTLKFMMLRRVGSGDQDVYLFQSTTGATGTLRFNWQHSIVGYNSGSIGVSISRNAWHYLEVNLNTTTDVVKIWFDTDACDNPASPSWVNSSPSGDGDYASATTIFQFNDNWSGAKSPATQNWYLDNPQASTTCIGDTDNLLGGGGGEPPPEGDPAPPVDPTTIYSLS